MFGTRRIIANFSAGYMRSIYKSKLDDRDNAEMKKTLKQTV